MPPDCLAKLTNSSDTPRNAPSMRIEFSFSRVAMLAWSSGGKRSSDLFF